MKPLPAFLRSPVFLGTLGMLALSALVWWVGPLVAVGSVRPLEAPAARVLALALLWAAWLGRLAWGVWRRQRLNAALVRGIAGTQDAASTEAQVLQQRFREAVDKLKAGGKGRLSGGGRTLYALPWYVFIGAPGSGKTTALLNAGLDFVMTDGGASVRGVGGTRNCEWWFTRDAVLIDTAGRYTLQESDRAVDAAAWDRFLSLLRRARPRRPVNGVLLTVSVPDLLQKDEAARRDHAAKLRNRLHELQEKLGVRPPVYVLVTKADLIAGFFETFDGLAREEREQVWGFTFPARGRRAADPLHGFEAEYRALQERLTAGLLDRLRSERDLKRRAAMFGFGGEFAGLKPLLADFLQQVFGSASALQEDVSLRGVYFTSGIQEGTPIDRVMGLLTRSFGVEQRAAAGGMRGKTFFLKRLMQDLVFPEAHLVSFNARLERRRMLVRTVGFAGIAFAATALVAGWAVSFLRNQAYAQQVAGRVPQLRSEVEGLPATGADPVPLIAPLDGVRTVAWQNGFRPDEQPLLHTLGLYQGDKLDAAAHMAYEKLLQQALAPRIARRLEERLRGAGRDNLEHAYEALKGYLMLHSPERFNPQALKAWITLDWDQQLRQLPAGQREALDRHLDALLELGAVRATAVSFDRQLVTSVREMLNAYPLEHRVYSRLQRLHRGEVADFTLPAAAGPNAARVFERTSGEPLARGVPGFYTREGYGKVFQQGPLAAAVAQLVAEEGWVLARPPRSVAAAVGTETEARVRRLYLEDYARTWERFLADVRLVRLDGLERQLEAARILAAVDSPLANLLRAAARETRLAPPPGEAKGAAKAAAAVSQARNELARLADPQAAPTGGGGPIELIVDRRFDWLHRLVQGQPAPIDESQKLFAEASVQLQAVDAAQKTKSAPPVAEVAKLKAAAAQQPQPVRQMLESLVDAGARQGRAAERDALSAELRPIYEFCMRAVANRYPLASGSRTDVLPEDFGHLFGPGGLMDEFYQRRLAALVDTSTTPWSYKPLPDGSRPAGDDALAEFQRAARIREVYFRSGGKVPSLRLDLRPLEFAPGLQEITLDVDGQTMVLVPGTAVTVQQPGARVASEIRLSAGGPPMHFEGPWALFRLFDRFQVVPGARPERFTLVMTVSGARARVEVLANSVFNPFRLRELQQFRCPGAL